MLLGVGVGGGSGGNKGKEGRNLREKWKGDIDNKEQIQLDMSVIPFL